MGRAGDPSRRERRPRARGVARDARRPALAAGLGRRRAALLFARARGLGPSRGRRWRCGRGRWGACSRGRPRRAFRSGAGGRGVFPSSQPKKTSRTSPRRWRATPPRKVAPASRARSTIGCTCSGVSLMPGISGAIRTPDSIPRRRSSATASRRALGARRVRLGRPPGLLVEGRHREVDRDRQALGDQPLEDLDVAHHQRRLGQDRDRRLGLLQRGEDLGHHPVAALDPLVGVGVRPQGDQLPPPGRLAPARPAAARAR